MTFTCVNARACLATLMILAGSAHASGASYTMLVEPIRPDGVFKSGEEVAFRIAAKRNGVPIAGQQLSYEITTADGRQLAAGTATMTRGPALVKAKVEGPAVVMCKASYSAGGISDSQSNAAVVSPDLFQPTLPLPDDFDAFWQAQRELLKSTPPTPNVQPVVIPEKLVPPHKQQFRGVVVQEIQMQVLEGIPPLRAHLARPQDAQPRSLPAIVYPQEDAVRFSTPYARQPRRGQPPPPKVDAALFGRAIPAARTGMLAMSYSFDDFPAVSLKPTPEADAAVNSTGDRQTHFLRGAILRQMAAIDFLTQQPEWNGKVLIVHGQDIGGGLALAAAGLDERVTLCIAARPAMCDLGANGAGWPYAPRPGLPPLPPPDEKSSQANRYFDAIGFARRIGCETVISVSYGDVLAPAPGIYAAFNSIPEAVNKRLIRVGESGMWGSWKKDEAQFDAIVRKHMNAPKPATPPPAPAPALR